MSLSDNRLWALQPCLLSLMLWVMNRMMGPAGVSGISEGEAIMGVDVFD